MKADIILIISLSAEGVEKRYYNNNRYKLKGYANNHTW